MIALLVIALCVTSVGGCTPQKTKLVVGMKMQDAVAAMNERGLNASKMGCFESHNAFDLPDRRTIVVIGDKTVGQIDIIRNPEVPKSERDEESVSVFEF